MYLRLELFVDDLDASIAFYADLLGFRVTRRTGDYVSLGRGQVVLGLGPVAKLSGYDDGTKGVGVEIVLELDTIGDVSALYEHCRSRTADIEPLQLRPWGLRDFRLSDPDGYYLRVTHRPGAGLPG